MQDPRLVGAKRDPRACRQAAVISTAVAKIWHLADGCRVLLRAGRQVQPLQQMEPMALRLGTPAEGARTSSPGTSPPLHASRAAQAHLLLAAPAVAQGEQARVELRGAVPAHAGGMRLPHKGHQRLQRRGDDGRVWGCQQAGEVLRGRQTYVSDTSCSNRTPDHGDARYMTSSGPCRDLRHTSTGKDCTGNCAG